MLYMGHHERAIPCGSCTDRICMETCRLYGRRTDRWNSDHGRGCTQAAVLSVFCLLITAVRGTVGPLIRQLAGLEQSREYSFF
jgi:hypothetical protein